jgi:dUTP pyrophosphatase
MDGENMKTINVKFKALRLDTITPTRGTDASAGLDLYACIKEPVCIKPGQTVCIPLGFATAIPDGWFGAVYARSQLPHA